MGGGPRRCKTYTVSTTDLVVTDLGARLQALVDHIFQLGRSVNGNICRNIICDERVRSSEAPLEIAPHIAAGADVLHTQ